MLVKENEIVITMIRLVEIAKQIEQDQQGKDISIINAGMENFTFPLSYKFAHAASEYWLEAIRKNQKARHYLSSSPKKQSKSKIDLIVQANGSVPYGDPRGILSARKKMAAALNNWYQLDDIFKPENVLFTVGDVGALHNVFEYLHYNFPNGRIVTPYPYYSLYAGVIGRENFLHPINVMKQKGYKLTAESLQESISEAKKAAKIDGRDISAFLFCDPNNPLGTVVDKDEWYKIADILRKEPDTLIILDEAYAEMVLNGEKNTSLVQVAPDLRDRIVLMRSATKGLSAAGERMAVMVAFNKQIMRELLKYNIAIVGHAPISLQHAYAEAMSAIDEIEHNNIIQFYQPQVNFVANRVVAMAAAMPDPDYKVEGTFYVLTDLSDLLGQHLEPAARAALGKSHCGIIQTDEDIAYHLLFKHNILIAPLSYYGLDKRLGYMRITCSGGDTEQLMLCNELEEALIEARVNKYKLLLEECNSSLDKINSLNKNYISEFSDSVESFARIVDLLSENSAKKLKDKILQLNNLLSNIKHEFAKIAEQDAEYCSQVTITQALCRSKLAKDEYQGQKQALADVEEWFRIKQVELEQQKRYAIEQARNSNGRSYLSFKLREMIKELELPVKIEKDELLEDSTDYKPKKRLIF